MNREERRREARRERAGGPLLGAPMQGQLIRSTRFEPGDEGRHRQDFLAGTVLAAGAAVVQPENGPGLTPLDALFTVLVHEDERTFGPAPQFAEAFALLDEIGGVALYDRMDVGTAWAGFGGPAPLVKLKLEFQGPRPERGSTALVLPASQYAEIWHHVVGGGMVAVSTQERMERAANRPGAGFADSLEASILLAIGTSPVLEQFIDAYGWPRR
ncbi:hypothetical protein [Streptomyces sp. NPDC050485]|uniref:hypothetical protein n=1 Tax=Streptomyces sp. NPDC050485 TaxID=3365617 RepID=UPI00379BAC7F